MKLSTSLKPRKTGQKFLDSIMYENVKSKIQKALDSDEDFIKSLLKNPTATPS